MTMIRPLHSKSKSISYMGGGDVENSKMISELVTQ